LSVFRGLTVLVAALEPALCNPFQGNRVAAAALYKHEHLNQLVELLPIVSKRNERIDIH
jgi:hypothetical protein